MRGRVTNSALTVLEAAAQGNDTATVRLVLAHGGDVKAKDGIGVTALMAAATHGNAEVVKLLLAKGSDVNAVTLDFFENVKNGPDCAGAIHATDTRAVVWRIPHGEI